MAAGSGEVVGPLAQTTLAKGHHWLSADVLGKVGDRSIQCDKTSLSGNAKREQVRVGDLPMACDLSNFSKGIWKAEAVPPEVMGGVLDIQLQE